LAVSHGRDVGSGVHAKQRVERLGRICEMLSSVDEAIVRVRQRLALFDEVCRVLVERAPLRAVDGFSKVLLDDYAEKLGQDGRHFLERVRGGAVRMGTLIDEILGLSRLSRQRFEREPVDISALAGEIVAELSSVEPDRRVEVEIEDGLVAEADRGLVQSVLQNRLGNALKLTANTERARVRFRAVEQDGVPVYFVAENGAGFDMAHAKGMFRPFQRLHRESEFPGSGIGLATSSAPCTATAARSGHTVS
jgi:light-regulated signal transduction histidine kinase (bacteriophytochrome)